MKSVITGIEKVYYSIYDEKADKFGVVKSLCEDGGIDFEVKVGETSTGLDSGNKQVGLEYGLGKIDVVTSITSLDTPVYSEIYGLQLATTGGIIYNSKRIANRPYIALMAEKTLNGGDYEYTTLFKGKMAIPDQKAVTQKEGKVEFQTLSLAGNFLPLANGDYMTVVRNTDVGFVQADFGAKWGKEVILPTAKV
ncbi:hypothetical protein KPL39_02165 [Clostridium gasigenes]|uniref:major tail protein n=1 Tax=Clostridium gasigenes TaxID=94869 RepID=UPI001C0B1356|nr:major tail protein [Clostridium gasigenes]MBU3135066.1 hypothetical protein [Clostridium gasigenes]